MAVNRRLSKRIIGAFAVVGIAGAASAVALTLAPPASAAVDIAVGKPATASSQQGSRPAEHGNDGSASTRWCASSGAVGQWWQVDLGAATPVTGSQVTWEFARNYRYHISVSTDGSSFTRVADLTATTSAAQTQAQTFNATARYVRITVTGLPTNVTTWASFSTFSVFGTPVLTPTTPPASNPPVTPVAAGKQRIAVLTDMSNEPDDEESMVRFLVYSNEYDVEALIATTSRHLRTGPREDLIRRQIAAYERVRPNLVKHAAGFPTAAHLGSVTATGQTAYNMSAVGAGKSTAGSRRLIAAADRSDSRPLWVSIWGGSNTLAQALFDVRATRTAAQLNAFIAKLRVYTISDQDDAGPWLRQNFPNLFYIVSPGTNYGGATWSGISGDAHYNNSRRRYHFNLVQNPWLTANIIRNHGPLGALYPPVEYIMEGDTPAFLGLVNNGLGWATSPSYGGWGGRYRKSGNIWTNSSDTFEGETTAQATIWRWRDHYQYDFAARMDWNIADTYAKANHNPVPALNGNRSKDVVTVNARGGTSVNLTASGTTDPDGNGVTLRWFIYGEAGTVAGASLTATSGESTTVRLPTGRTGTVHVILQATDNGSPNLTSYRRVVVNVTA